MNLWKKTMSRLLACLTMAAALLLLFVPTAVAGEETSFRVVGYYSATSFDEPLDQVQMDCYTHIMYGFLKPQTDGSVLPVPKPELLKQLVKQAHEQDVKVFAAVGGYSYENKPLEPTFAAMAANAESRARFVQEMTDIVRLYQLDGIELDQEYPKQETAQSYEALVLELAQSMHSMGKELSAAVAGATAANERAIVSKMITPIALEALDFVEIMAYDLHTTEHSPLWFARTSVEYWTQKLPRDKVVLGVPLYARPSWVQYRHLVQADAENAYRNFVPAGTVSKLDSSYNGLPLLHDKAVYALKNTGGIMFFDIHEDVQGPLSAVSMVDELVQQYQDIGKEAFEKQVWLYLDQHPLEFSADEDMGQPFIDSSGRVQIPLRKVAQAIGATVVYQQTDQSITLYNEQQTVKLTVNQPNAQIGGTEYMLDCVPQILDGRTYIPARTVFESFDYQVQWNSHGRSIYLDLK